MRCRYTTQSGLNDQFDQIGLIKRKMNGRTPDESNAPLPRGSGVEQSGSATPTNMTAPNEEALLAFLRVAGLTSSV